MFTLFTIPKPFKNTHISIIQRNAIQSWKMLNKTVEIFLCGSDYGVKETADEFHVKHMPDIETNNLHTPLLSSAFEEVKKKSSYQIICYINCDIILLDNFLNLFQYTKTFNEFLIVGRRVDLSIDYPITEQKNWQEKIKEKIDTEGILHGPSGIDYFIFPKHFSIRLKPFPVGRPGWDNWFIFEARKKKIPIIDATKMATVVHQNHDYSHYPGGRKALVYGVEVQKNIQYTDNLSSLMNILGATLLLTPQGLKPPALLRKLYGWLLLFYPTRKLFSLKRRLNFYLNRK